MNDAEPYAFLGVSKRDNPAFRLSLFLAALAVCTFARGNIKIVAYSRIDEHVNPFLTQLQEHGVAKIYDLPGIGWTAFAEGQEPTEEDLQQAH